MDKHSEYVEDSALKAENIMYGSYNINSYSSVNERVIYLGCFIKQWGHFIVDFIPRLWYLIDGAQDCRIAYVSMKNSQIDGVYEDLLNLFGIDSNRLIYIKDITQFNEVVVPQTAYERPNFYYNVNQFPINEMCGGKITYIDAHASFFPNSADKGPYWLVYNKNLEKFALDNNFDVPQSILRSRGKVRKKDFNKYCTTYFNTYTGSELKVNDAGIAGRILGRSRPLSENMEEHEIYYYYRKQFGQINNKEQIIKAIKEFIKKTMKKAGK